MHISGEIRLEMKILKTWCKWLVEDKMRETRLRWFEHVKCRCIDGLVRTCERLTVVELRTGRGRPKTF